MPNRTVLNSIGLNASLIVPFGLAIQAVNTSSTNDVLETQILRTLLVDVFGDSSTSLPGIHKRVNLLCSSTNITLTQLLSASIIRSLQTSLVNTSSSNSVAVTLARALTNKVLNLTSTSDEVTATVTKLLSVAIASLATSSTDTVGSVPFIRSLYPEILGTTEAFGQVELIHHIVATIENLTSTSIAEPAALLTVIHTLMAVVNATSTIPTSLSFFFRNLATEVDAATITTETTLRSTLKNLFIRSLGVSTTPDVTARLTQALKVLFQVSNTTSVEDLWLTPVIQILCDASNITLSQAESVIFKRTLTSLVEGLTSTEDVNFTNIKSLVVQAGNLTRTPDDIILILLLYIITDRANFLINDDTRSFEELKENLNYI